MLPEHQLPDCLQAALALPAKARSHNQLSHLSCNSTTDKPAKLLPYLRHPVAIGTHATVRHLRHLGGTASSRGTRTSALSGGGGGRLLRLRSGGATVLLLLAVLPAALLAILLLLGLLLLAGSSRSGSMLLLGVVGCSLVLLLGGSLLLLLLAPSLLLGLLASLLRLGANRGGGRLATVASISAVRLLLGGSVPSILLGSLLSSLLSRLRCGGVGGGLGCSGGCSGGCLGLVSLESSLSCLLLGAGGRGCLLSRLGSCRGGRPRPGRVLDEGR